MKKIAMICIALVCISARPAKDIDRERMNRDLEVSKSILKTLLSAEGLSGRIAVEASYVQGYGVIFTLPASRGVVRGFDNNVMVFPAEGSMIFHDTLPGWIESHHFATDTAMYQFRTRRNDGAYDKAARDADAEALRESIRETARVAADAARKAMDEARRAIERERGRGNLYGSAATMRTATDYEKIARTFFADYGDLIAQLKPEDKVVFRVEMQVSQPWMDESANQGGFRAEVSRADISAFKQGSLSKEAFDERIIINNDRARRSNDLEVFGSIIHKFFGRELSNTFFVDRVPGYEWLEGYGAIYSIDTYSSYTRGRDFIFPTQGQKTVDAAGRQELIESLYPKFREDIMDFVLDYGRTLKSLPEHEKLHLKIKITECKGCNVPAYLEIIADISDLRKFDQQKISRDKMRAALDIEEI
ncbi:MAG: hypothetical protein JJU28_18000 [Cyclobacteriaceae bacterium]|nr:hypothetical protein [Cyclobacteriaceae bacterium]